MRSQETTNSAWYYPWAWYYSTSTTEMETSTDESETRGRQNTNAGVWEGLTPSEQIKEEALARSSSAPPSSNPTADAQPPLGAAEQIPSSQSTMTVDAFKKEHNPIEGSMASNMSGWSSLFSYAGRTLMAKSIGAGEDGTAKEEAGGMEVMDLDEEEGEGEGAEASGGAGSQAQTTSVAQTQSQTVATKGKPRSSSLLGPASQPVSVINKKSSLSSVRSGTPSPKSSERPKSPAASGSKTPPPPTSAKPNLVLPTWEDTFDIPPRSIVPLPERKEDDEGTLKKGWKFINNVLINPPGGPKIKGKARSAPLSGGSRQRTISERGGLRGRPGRSGLSGKREEGVPGGEGREGVDDWSSFGLGLPRSHETMRKHAPQDGGVKRSRLRRGSVSSSAGPLGDEAEDVLRGCKRVAVLAIHGWFPGAMMRTVLGEPTGTSIKFASMMVQALEEFQEHHGVKFDKVTQMPLEGEGTISKRVDKLYSALTSNEEWISDLHAADVIFVATHSQGSIVSTHLLDRLIQDKHIRTAVNVNEAAEASEVVKDAAMDVASGVGGIVAPSSRNLENKKQRVCCLCLCGIHLGPLRYLSSSSLVLPYIQYFESTAARELFEFQNTESQVSKSYVRALRNVLNHGTKMVYTASLNDQVVPIYSGIFHAASHPLILRALYIDGDAYHSTDFLSNLLVLLLRILNSGLSDSGLLVHLSEATAGSLNGVGHSTIYEELGTYSLAVNYLFLTNDGLEEHPELVVEPFNANTEQNDYEIPWALRDLIADERVAYFFGKAFADLKTAFPHWHPKTTILRDIKRKLQPIQRLSNIAASYMDSTSLNSKL
ncbi:uncharacterized protein STEHIDRAFT_123267 [Stereum hirsutum FP-91666 SS1]|uniref:uncharacterized protein n=1 Tax=Stereum hirsutum (strain FP-91666) TaxID=721885 RepID=UPI00044497C3|nr:uncharacterized protein STEHIDRAFT_123267 [Stereum hirsutum FP-91666 SS1]EIM84487.1 hypothetical protein STEHIDRAFT_123267 [Stereum hirsutum FP-91666 SS1]